MVLYREVEEKVHDSHLPHTILLVEDQALIALYEAQMLRKHGYQVLTVHTAEDAILTVHSNPVDLILMDINLGSDSMDGTDAAEKILEDFHIPIVFLTSHAEQEYVRRVKGITRYGYVIKESGEFVLLEAISMAAELFQRELMVQARNKELRTLLKVSKINLEQQDVEQTLQKTTDSIVELLDFNSSALYLVEDTDTLRLMAATPSLPPDLPDFIRTARLESHPQIARAIDSGAPLYVQDTEKVDFTDEEATIARDRNLRSILYLPLYFDNSAIGILITGSSVPVQLKDHTIQSCVSLGNIASMTISNARMYQKYKQRAKLVK